MAASCFGLRTISLLFWKFQDPFERFLGLGHIYFDLVVFRMSGYAWKTNFWCHILIDGLTPNQFALMLHVRGRTEFGKVCGIDCRQFLFSPPPPPSRSPGLSTSPQFFAHPGMLLRLPAFSLACFICPGKRKETAATQASSDTVRVRSRFLLWPPMIPLALVREPQRSTMKFNVRLSGDKHNNMFNFLRHLQ